jgi:hypothetical protein
MKLAMSFLSIVAAGMVLGACGSSGTATRTVVTVVRQVPAPPASESQSRDAGDSSSTDAAPEPGSVSDQRTGGGGSGGKIAVPNEVGKQHQAAQDDLQAHGLFNIAEEDATGQGRLLLIDRNWHVVAQSPAAGEKVADDAAITLKSKKYTDP